MSLPDRIILFDGVCVVCDAGMTWILDHDPHARFCYAPLQGQTAAAIIARHPELPRDLDSLVYVEQTPGGERVAWHSTALLNIAAELPAPWRSLALLRVVPAPLRDLAYRAFAAVRYRLFGRLEACRIPKPGEAERFLD